jgi:CheY-like chemotaxis protein
MNGNIWVESEMGRGSVFHVSLQLPIAGDIAVGPSRSAIDVIGGTRVLVVDDNETNRQILEEMLKNWGMVPATAESAQRAMIDLQQARSDGTPFRIVLTDVNMPEVDGFDFAELVRKEDAKLGKPSILMLTSGDRPGDLARSRKIGVAAYLMKPVKQSELFDAIATALGVATAEDESSASATEPPAQSLQPLRILLAEDSHVNQKLAVGLLQKQGHTVVIANNGQEAITAWETQSFDLILMDVQMPLMDGCDATCAIRAKEVETGGHIPIIAMTAHAMKGDREHCLKSGMDDYISKPIRARQLIETIATVLHRLEESPDP